MKKTYKTSSKVIAVFFVIFFQLSCMEAAKESQKILVESQKPTLEGKFFPIHNQGIKLFLPKEFKNLPKEEYLDLVKKSNDTIALSMEKERIRTLFESGNEIYLYQHEESSSILSVIPTDYFKFNKADAQMLLNQIKYSHDEVSSITGFVFNKQEARFFETKDAQIFKAIYKVAVPSAQREFFKQVYFVSFNKKSFALSLETPFLVDFDPYLEKIRIL